MRSSLVARRSSLVARRSSLVASLIVSLLLLPSASSALDLTPDAQIGITKSSLSAQSYAVWARRSDGRLVSRRDQSLGDFVWYAYDKVDQQNVSLLGVAATSWFGGGTTPPAYGSVTYVDTAGMLVVRFFTNGAETSHARYAAPANKTLTGQVAITTSFNPGSGTRFLRVYVTTNQNDLYYLRIDPEQLDEEWFPLSVGDVSTTAPIATTVSPDAVNLRVFITNNTNTSVKQWRYDGTNWHLFSLGGIPGAGTGCGTAAAAQGQLVGGVSTTVLYCTRQGLVNGRIYRAVATGLIANPAWQGSFELPPLEGTIRNYGYSIAATAQPNQTATQSIDGWVIGTTGSKLWHFSRKPGQVWQGPADLGYDLETEYRAGGLAASPRQAGATFLYFAGKVAAAYRLYRRVGDESYPASVASNWANHQIGDPVHLMTDETNDHAESTTAFYRGRAMIAAMVFNGGDPPNTLSTIETAYSSNDGDTWNEPTVPAPLSGFDRLADPSLDFSDDGTAHLVVRAEDWTDAACGALPQGPYPVLHLTSTGGANWSQARQIDTGTNGDHPFHRIERRAGQDDLVHFIWKDETQWPGPPTPDPEVVDYRSGTWNGPSLTLNPGIYPLSDPTGTTLSVPGAPTLSVGKDGATWVAWLDMENTSDRGDDTFHVCRINAARDGCTGPDQFLGVNGSATVLTDAEHVPFRARPRIPIDGGGNDEHIKTSENWSIRASQADSTRLYLAFSQREDPGNSNWDSPVDVYFSVLVHSDNGTPADETDDTITASIPYEVSTDEVYGDGTDQFMPQVTTTLDAMSQEMVSVAWYDRSVDCDVSGVVQHNRCYRIRRSVSFFGGTFFQHTQDIAPPEMSGPNDLLSDPHCLPRLCGAGARFVGDYNEVVGDSLHSMHVMVRSRTPDECEIYDDEYSFVTSGWVSGGYWYYP